MNEFYRYWGLWIFCTTVLRASDHQNSVCVIVAWFKIQISRMVRSLFPRRLNVYEQEFKKKAWPSGPAEKAGMFIVKGPDSGTPNQIK